MATEITNIAASCGCCVVACPVPSMESRKATIHCRVLGFEKDGKLYRKVTTKDAIESELHLSRDVSNTTGEWKVTYASNDSVGIVSSNYTSTTSVATLKFEKEYESISEQILSYLNGGLIPAATQHSITLKSSTNNIVSIIPPSVEHDLDVYNNSDGVWRDEKVTALVSITHTGFSKERTPANDLTQVVKDFERATWDLTISGSATFPEGTATITTTGWNDPYEQTASSSNTQFTYDNEITKAYIESELQTLQKTIDEDDWLPGPSESELLIPLAIERHTSGYFYHYYDCDQITARTRFIIPNHFEGSYYKIKYALLDQDGNQVDQGEVEWTGPGISNDPDSWATSWINIPMPTSEGKVTLNPKAFKCYHSAPWTNF